MTGSRIIKSTDEQGRVTFGDRPMGDASRIESFTSQGRPRVSQETQQDSQKTHDRAIAASKEAQKRIPKLHDYVQYFKYLRDHGRFWRMDRAMAELKKQDLQAWVKLQQHPQFQPFLNRALGIKAADKNITAGLGIITGSYSGSVEKWLETTVQDMMKADRWGPYADVLGTKASTLPTKTATYSKSRLGQHLQVEDPRAAGRALEAAKDMESGRAAIRSSISGAFSRIGGTILDVELALLKPETHQGFTNFLVENKLKKALGSGALNDEQYETAHALLSQGKIKELEQYLGNLRRTNLAP